MKFSDLKFLLKTWRFPNTYRKLFRELSNLYLTSESPGATMDNGTPVFCITNRKPLVIRVGSEWPGAQFLVDRESLKVRIAPSFESVVPLYDPSVRTVKEIFDYWIERGIPFKMSDTGVSNPGI